MGLGECLVPSSHSHRYAAGKNLTEGIQQFSSICHTYHQIKTGFIWEHSTHLHKSRKTLAKERKGNLFEGLSFSSVNASVPTDSIVQPYNRMYVLLLESSNFLMFLLMLMSNSSTTNKNYFIKCRVGNRAILQNLGLLLQFSEYSFITCVLSRHT